VGHAAADAEDPTVPLRSFDVHLKLPTSPRPALARISFN
jgi:hypothetical protein